MKINRQILKLAFGLFLTINAFGQIPTNGQISYYKFSQSNSNSMFMADEKGNNNGSVTNGTGFFTDRKTVTGQAISLGGASNFNNYVTINNSGNSSTINSMTDISFSLWYKKEDATGSARPVVGIGDANKYYQLNYDAVNNKFSFTHFNGTTTSSVIESAVISIGTWTQVAVTISTANNTCILYVNGSIQGSNLQTISMPSNPSITLARRIGATLPNFPATFDDFYIYNRVLNATEIYSFYDDVCSSYFTQAPTLTFNGTNMLTQTYAGANYAWSLNGSSISGANSNIYSGTISAGTYMVTVTNAACKSSASFVQANDVVNTLSGLVAYYPFNGNANEENNNWINGTITGATNTTDRYEEVNKSLNFTNNTFVSFGSNSVPPIILGNKTKFVSAWIMPTQNRNSIFCLGTNITNGNTYRFISNTNGFLGLDVTNGSGYSNSVKLELNIWNFVFSYFDGTKYIVGKVNESGILTSSISGMPLNNLIQGTFEIGKETFSNFYTNGKLDEVRLYNRVLNPSEISALYTEGCDAYFAQAPTLTLDGTSMLTQTYAGANYAWSLNGSSISGANSNVYSGTISAGTYNVTITNAACKSVASYVQANDVVNTANGLVAYYPFNGNANDESGNGNNGSITGVLNDFDRYSSTISSQSFTGINSKMSLLGNNNFNFGTTSGMTLGAWFKSNNNSGTRRIISNGHFNWSNGYILGMNWVAGGGDITFGVGGGNSSNSFLVSTPNIYNDSKWHFVSAVIDRNSNKVYIYVDGKKQILTKYVGSSGIVIGGNSLDVSGLNALSLTSNENFYIGQNNANFERFIGSLDQVSIYNRALNQSEISALWDNCIGTDINTMNLPISGSNSVCLGSSNTFSIASTTGISYNWAVSGGNTFTVNGNNLNVSANNLGVYTITAVPTYACGNGTVTSSFVVSVSGAAPTPTITGNLLPKSCISENYLATVSSGSGSYTWATSDSHILASASTVGITFTSTGIKQISVTRIDAQCNFSTTSSINVTVTAPNLATPILARTTNLSNLQSTNVTTPGTSFQWVKDNLDEAGETSSTHNNQLENATYKLRADLGLCATAVSDPYNVFVVTFIPAAVTVVSPPVTITSAPVTITSAPVTVTSAPVTITSAPITVTSVVTVSSPPVTVTSVVTVSSPPVTVTSVINNCTSTGTNNNRLTTSFSIYPNPSSGVFTIESEGVEIYSIKVYASDGRLVYHEKFASKLDLSNLPSGIYKLIAYDKEDKPLGSVNIAKE